MSDELIVRVDDLAELGYCHRGARRWFARHGLDWARFVQMGLPVETIEATGDAMARRLADHVRAKRG